jgi:hypothetical protein
MVSAMSDDDKKTTDGTADEADTLKHIGGSESDAWKGGLWLSFLNTVRTERFDQVLAIKALLSAIARAAFRPYVGCVRNREAAAGEESAMTHRMAKILAV